MRVGLKFLLRAADMSTGKYGIGINIGINTITLNTKLNSIIPKYSSSRPKLKKFSIITNNLTYLSQAFRGLKSPTAASHTTYFFLLCSLYF
jgi:hypothetical protein